MLRTRLGHAALAAVILAVGTQIAPLTVSRAQNTDPVIITGAFRIAYPGYETIPLVVALSDASGFWGKDPIYLLPKDQQMIGTTTGGASRGEYEMTLPAEPNGRAFNVQTGALQNDAPTKIYDVRLLSDVTVRGYMVENEDPIASTMQIDVGATVSGGTIFVFSTAATEFPIGLGADEKLFTADDPRAAIQSGYTRVDFGTDYSNNPFILTPVAGDLTIDLTTTGAGDVNDYSKLKCADLIPTFLTRVEKYYGFTELKKIDWAKIRADLIPPSQTAKEGAECEALIVRFAQYIPDGHVNFFLPSVTPQLAGSLGLLMAQTTDSKIIASFVVDGGQAAQGGIVAGAEITAWDGKPIAEAMKSVTLLSSNSGTPAALADLQLFYLTRGTLGSKVDITFTNPNAPSQIATFTRALGVRANVPRESIPVQANVLPSGLGYIRIADFGELDDLTTFDQQVTALIAKKVPGILIDVRSNPGGFSQISDAMSSRFFTKSFTVGDQISDDGRYTYTSRVDPRDPVYEGKVAILVDADTASSGDIFAYTFKIAGRAIIVGNTPSAGMAGTVSGGQYQLPNGGFIQVPTDGFYDANGKIAVEGEGVAPDVLVPVTVDSLLDPRDEVFHAAEDVLLK